MHTDEMNTAIRIRAAAIIIRDGNVLLVEHAKGNSKYWLFPGGGVDLGEGMKEAAQREVLEEISLKVRINDLAFVAETIAPKGHHGIHITFYADLISGEPKLGSDPRISGWSWFPIGELSHIILLPNVGDTLSQAWDGSRFAIPPFLPSVWKELS